MFKNFKKYKQLFIGVLIGSLLFGAVPTLAASKISAVIDDITIKVNGAEVKTDTPIVYQNKTYVPIRAVVEKLGANVQWDGDTKTVDINTVSQAVAQTVPQKPSSTPDGITEMGLYNGKYYISFIVAKNKLKERGYILDEDYSGVWSIKKDDKIILDNLDMPMVYGSGRLEYNYYINTILPITQ